MTHAVEDLFPSRRLALVRASSVFLERLLQLPPGSSIVSVTWCTERQECMLAITGPTMPVVAYGDEVPWVAPAVRVDLETGRAHIMEWPQS